MPVRFEEQNAIGRESERKVADLLRDAGWLTQWKYRGARHDIFAWAPSGPELIEVKNEDAYADGDNACFEISQKGRCAGLLRSESTVGVHTFGEQCLVYRTQLLRVWLQAEVAAGRLHVRDFGDNENRGVLVPKVLLAARAWAEFIPLARLPQSKVLRPN